MDYAFFDKAASVFPDECFSRPPNLGVILGSGGIDESLVRMCRAAAVPVLDFDAKAMENGEYIEKYNAFYDSL